MNKTDTFKQNFVLNSNIKKSLLFALIGGLFFLQKSNAQLVTTTAITPTQLVRNVLLGHGIGATGITYTGADSARGKFYGYASDIGLDSGVILSSGQVSSAIGPNNESSITGVNRKRGDADLDLIMAPTRSFDAAILEFDFIPTSDTVRFRYVFGSEEYMCCVDTTTGVAGINDGFGFFISGPGISGPFSRGSQNIALIPGPDSLPVTMHNLNYWRHSELYVPNGDGAPGIDTSAFGISRGYEHPDGLTVQYNAFTTPLTALALVECGKTYHIKLAVGDGGDDILDSGVFLEAGSFESFGSLLITPTTSLGSNISDNDSTMYEGCGSVSFLFERDPSTIDTAESFYFTFNGTATPGMDYSVVGDSVYFAAGEDSVYLTFNSLADMLTEPTETMTIQFIRMTPCGTYDTASSTIYIVDSPPIKVSLNNDTILNCPFHDLPLTATATGGVAIGNYNYSWTGSTSIQDTIEVNPSVTTTYYITVTDTCGNMARDSIQVSVVPYSPLELTMSNDTTICSGNSVFLSTNVSNGRLNYTYSWSPLVSTSDSVTVSPTSSTLYKVTITDACGYSISDSTTISVLPITAEFNYTFTTNQTAQFHDESSGSMSYLWDFGDGSQDSSSTDQNPSHFYPNDGTYTITLISTSSIGCIDTISKTVIVSPDFYFYYPNAFSPDGNGVNDIYKGYGAGIKSFRMRIFNRWGEELFHTTDQYTGWDGTTSGGSRAPLESYIVMFDLEGYHSEVKRYIGTIILAN